MTQGAVFSDLPDFDLYVGIDWSGAKGNRHRGIALAACAAGDAVPCLIPPPHGQRAWSRKNVADWLLQESQHKKVCAGIDFAFAHPFDDLDAYYPEIENAPASPQALWQMIDEANQDKEDFYGGGLWAHAAYGPFYNAPRQRGARFTSRRRQTETKAAKIKSPSPTFNCVGPAGVGTGSLAGMRVLHHLKDHAAIWPFDAPQNASLVLTEIFPSYYFVMAGLKPIKGAHGEAAFLNAGLAYFASKPVADSYQATGPDADLSDAMISAAALRYFSRDQSYWQLEQAAVREGWIIGVKPD